MTGTLKGLRSGKYQVFLIIVLGIAIYFNTLNAPFVFDDLLYITDNAAIKDLKYLIEPSTIEDAIPPDTLVGYTFSNRFVGFVTFALNYYLGSLYTFGYHIVNLAIHVFNAILVYRLVSLTLRVGVRYQVSGDREQLEALNLKPIHSPEPICWANPFTYLPLFIALIFVAHPIQTQAVTYISQRFTSLATFFYLLSVVMYIKFRLWVIGNRLSVIGYRSWVKSITYYLLSVFSAIFAMKTKEIAFTLPVIIALFEFMFLYGGMRKRILYLFPFLLAMFIIPIGIIGMDRPAGELISGIDEATRAKAVISRGDYLYTEFRVIVTYIRLLFLPINQNLDYDYPIYNSFCNLNVFLSFLSLLSIFGLGVYLFYRSRFTIHDARQVIDESYIVSRHSSLSLRLVSFGIFWFFVTLSVESSIIPTQDVIFEHRMYLPSIGAIIALVSAVGYIVNSKFSRFRFSLAASCLLLAAIVASLSITTYKRNITWMDDIVLWKDTAIKSPDKPRVHHELGLVYLNRGMLDEAITEFETAIRLKPDYFLAHKNLSVVYYKKVIYDEAIREIQITLMLGENKKDVAYGNIGAIYLKKELADKAIEYLEYAVGFNPEYAAAYHNLGIAYSSKGLKDKAAEYFNKAYVLDPDKYPERSYQK